MAKASLSECLTFSVGKSKPGFMKIMIPVGEAVLAVKSAVTRPANTRPDQTCAKWITVGTVNNLGTVSSLTGLAVLRLCGMYPQGKPWLLMSTKSPRLLESGYIGVEAGGVKHWEMRFLPYIMYSLSTQGYSVLCRIKIPHLIEGH